MSSEQPYDDEIQYVRYFDSVNSFSPIFHPNKPETEANFSNDV